MMTHPIFHIFLLTVKIQTCRAAEYELIYRDHSIVKRRPTLGDYQVGSLLECGAVCTQNGACELFVIRKCRSEVERCLSDTFRCKLYKKIESRNQTSLFYSLKATSIFRRGEFIQTIIVSSYIIGSDGVCLSV